MKEKECFLIANAKNTEFICRDATSGGYPYVTDTLQFCFIGGYDFINKYYDGLELYIKDASKFSIKRIVLEDI